MKEKIPEIEEIIQEVEQMNPFQISQKLSQIKLEAKTLHLNPWRPYKWASGYYMPVYDDHRVLSAYYNRVFVAAALAKLIKKRNKKIDMIGGVSTAGIVPATTVAQILDVPLVIINDKKPYVFEQPIKAFDVDTFNAVASTAPWGIPFGVATANLKKLPFMYVRRERKDHGLEQQIEGVFEEGQRALLLEYHKWKKDIQQYGVADSILREAGLEVSPSYSENIADLKPSNISGKIICPIDDIITIPDKLTEEIQIYRDFGAKVNSCYGIASFNFEEARLIFGARSYFGIEETKKLKKSCECYVLQIFQDLIEAAREFDVGKGKKYLDVKRHKLLMKEIAEWRDKSFYWWNIKQRDEIAREVNSNKLRTGKLEFDTVNPKKQHFSIFYKTDEGVKEILRLFPLPKLAVKIGEENELFRDVEKTLNFKDYRISDIPYFFNP